MAKETQKDVKNAESAVSKAESEASKKGQKIPRESAYSVAELAASAKKVFRTRQECVMAALKAAGKAYYTVTEAKEIVEKFMRRKVD